jgi:hypothetical protein
MNHPWWDKKDNDASDVTQASPHIQISRGSNRWPSRIRSSAKWMHYLMAPGGTAHFTTRAKR